MADSLKGALGAERLWAYWAHEEGADKIRWGTPGDLRRCEEHLSKTEVRDPARYCRAIRDALAPATGGRMRAYTELMAELQRAGPHGYIHGWIKVGAGVSPKNHKAFLDSHYSGWRNGLTPAHDKALRFYQSPGFALMNGQLRGLDTGGLKAGEHATGSDLARAAKASKDLTAAIRKAPPLEHALTVYRGFSADQFGDLKPGSKITDRGFTSTSLTDDVQAVGRAGRPAVAEILLPEGTKAGAGSARELILPPGATFRVAEAGRKGGVMHVKLELIPPGRK